MTSPSTLAAARPDPAGAPMSVVALLAVGAGFSAASLYYNQPILGAIARDLEATPAAVGWLPTSTQLGYASGIFLFAPLGDRFDLRRVIVAKGAALALALTLAGLAPSITLLAAASLAVGLLATTAQDFVPAAAALAPPTARGRIVGIAMTGLLLGILLSRVVSGFVGEHLGWRAVYFGAAAAVASVTALAHVRLPTLRPTATASYGALLRSTLGLLRAEPLRRAALAQALLAVAFSGFWSTLALALAEPPHRMGSTVAGAFGLAGAAGALVAPIAGSIADKRGPERVIRSGVALVIASFASMAVAPASLPVLITGTIAFDLGVHASLISHQTIVYGLDATARSRSNAVLVSSMFLGMAGGSAAASRVFAAWGFAGVAVLGAGAATLAMLVRVLPADRGGANRSAP